MMTKVAVNLFVLFAATAARAASGGHDDHIPWSELIIPQIVNFTILFVVLFMLLKGKVVAFFAEKKQAFEAAVKTAEQAKITAERANEEVRSRLKRLEDSAKASIEDAKKEAAQLRERLVQEARATADKLSFEAERTAQFEHERAIAALRLELVGNAVKVAEDEVRTRADGSVAKVLRQDFLNKIEGARP